MTTPQITVGETEHGRFYDILLGDRQPFSLPSVTNILNPLSAPGLIPWVAWLTSTWASENVLDLVAAMIVPPCGRTHYAHEHTREIGCSASCPCGSCGPCVARKLMNLHMAESSRRADEGGRFHTYAEMFMIHGEGIRVKPDIQPYVDTFNTFVKDYALTPDDVMFTEAVALAEAERHAGTCDGAIRFRATTEASAWLVAAIRGVTVAQALEGKLTVLLMVDWKTREKEDAKFYPNQALQLAAYRFSTHLFVRNSGRLVDMPKVDGTALIQIRPDGYTVRPTVSDEAAYQAFLRQRDVFEWLRASGTASVSSRSIKPVSKTEGAKREAAARREARAAAKAAAPAKVAKPRKGTPGKAPVTAVPVLEPDRLYRDTVTVDSGLLGEPGASARPLITDTVTAGVNYTTPTAPDPRLAYRQQQNNRPVHPDSPLGDEIPF